MALRCTCAPRLSSDRTTHRPGRPETSGRIRSLASTRWNSSSAGSSSGYFRISEVARDSSSLKPSTPENPPPANVTVSRRWRRGPGLSVEARSKAVSSRSRIATASSTCFIPIACSATPGIGQLAGHRAGGDDDDVVAERELRALGRLHGGRPVRVVDRGDRARDEPGPAQVPAQRHRGVPRFDRAGQHLGKKRLIRHVRPRIDYHDPRLVPPELLFQLPGGVKAGVAAANHQNRTHVGPLFSRRQQVGLDSTLVCDIGESASVARWPPAWPGRPPLHNGAVRAHRAASLGSGTAGARGRSAWPGHQARRPMSAVRLGEKNIAITNAASAMPHGDGEAHLGQDRVAGQHQRGEGAGQDQPGRGDRRAGVPERHGGRLPRAPALPGLLAQPGDHQDVVVGARARPRTGTCRPAAGTPARPGRASPWNTSTVAPRVAPKPSPTESIRYQGATTLRSSSPRMSRMITAATGNTTA